MKAKMATKPPETAKYFCQVCNTIFVFGRGELSCPHCGNVRRVDLIPIGIRDNPSEEELYTSDDWHGG